MTRRSLIKPLFLIFFVMGTAFAGANPKSPAKIVSDTSRILVRSFDQKAIQKYKANRDFDYSGNGVVPHQSLWSRFWAWLWRWLGDRIGSVPGGAAIVEYTLLAVTTGLLVFLILKSLGITTTKLWRGESEQINLQFDESLENIHEINFDTEIEKAVSQHNYRLAVRLLYLKCLKQLSDAKLINWQIEKSNATYLRELTEAGPQQTFGKLTRQFEYVWYGDFPIDGQTYGNILNLFQDFKKQLP
jgi:hypothetical protein